MNPNQVVTTTGFGSRIMSAIAGVPVGIVLIFGSCFMLYWNEGRTDYSKIAAQSVPVQSQQVDQSANGKFVSVTGSITGRQIGDGAYLKPVSTVAVQRIVEQYAWVETQHTQSHDNTGGSQTNTTTYTYAEQWVDRPADSSTFHNPSGHQNSIKPLNDTLVKAPSSQVGAYTFDPQTIKLPSLQDMPLNAANTMLPDPTVSALSTPVTGCGSGTSRLPYNCPAQPLSSAPATATAALSNISLASSQYLYGGTGNLATPQLGDIRISYKDLPTGTTVTVFGQLDNGTVDTYTDASKHSVYELLKGDRQTAIATLHNQYQKTAWILRGVGIGLIWIGLMMLLAPLDMLLDFIPFVGEIGGALSLVITLPIALVLGGTVIVIGYTMHHILALVIGVPVIFAVWIGMFKLIKRGRGIAKRSNSPPATTPQTTSNPYTSPAMPNSGSLFPTNASPAPRQEYGTALAQPIQPAPAPQQMSQNPTVITPDTNPPPPPTVD